MMNKTEIKRSEPTEIIVWWLKLITYSMMVVVPISLLALALYNTTMEKMENRYQADSKRPAIIQEYRQTELPNVPVNSPQMKRFLRESGYLRSMGKWELPPGVDHL